MAAVSERDHCLAWTKQKLREAAVRWPDLGQSWNLDKLAGFMADEILRQQWATRLVDSTERDLLGAYQNAQHYREKAEAALEMAAKYAECYAGRFPENVVASEMKAIRAARADAEARP